MTRTRLVFFGILVAVLTAALAACAGLDAGDLVRVKTPHAIQQQTGLPSAVTLNEAQTEYRAWYEGVQRAGSQWKARIERGNEFRGVRGLLNQLSLSALDQVGPTLAGVPVLGPALPAVTGLLGLFLGTGRLRKEKEASYNKGLERFLTPGSGPGIPSNITGV